MLAAMNESELEESEWSNLVNVCRRFLLEELAWRCVVTSSGASNLLLSKLEVPCWVPMQNGMSKGLLHVSSCAGFSA